MTYLRNEWIILQKKIVDRSRAAGQEGQPRERRAGEKGTKGQDSIKQPMKNQS